MRKTINDSGKKTENLNQETEVESAKLKFDNIGNSDLERILDNLRDDNNNQGIIVAHDAAVGNHIIS